MRAILRQLVRVVVVVLGVSMMLGGVVFASASARSLDSVDLAVTTVPVKVTTSTGMTVWFGLKLYDSADCGECGAGVDLSLATVNGRETHRWSNEVSGIPVVRPTDSAPGSYDSNAALGPIGRVELSITPVGDQTNRMCGTDVGEVDQQATIAGTVNLDTQTSGPKAWGTVGTATEPVQFTTTAALKYLVRDCLPYERPCEIGKSWGSGELSGAINHDAGTPTRQITFTNDLVIPGTHEMVGRIDTYTGMLRSVKLRISGKRATVDLVGGGGWSSGSGKITAKHQETVRLVCGPHNRKVKATYFAGRFQNGRHPFTVHSSAWGDATAIDAGAGINWVVRR